MIALVAVKSRQNMIIFYNCINTRRKVMSTNIGHLHMVPLWEGNWHKVCL